MYDLYTFTTPNGRKASIMLEEIGAPYTAHTINILENDQFKPDFLRISPNNKIPAIVDKETGQTLFESGAILLYLAEKHGQLLPSGENRWRAVEWLMWQMGGFGPMLGQAHHFLKFQPGKAPYAEERFSNEANRLYRVLNDRLEGRDFIADEYSVADIAIWPWTVTWEWQNIDLTAYSNVLAWYNRIADRPAVQRGFAQPIDRGPIPRP